MKFTVIVPTHNRCDSLRKTIDSIRRQDFRDFEIIVVNDGSSDGTHEYLTQFITDTAITYIQQPNLGPARARNAGIKQAKGTFVAFTDDDCAVPPGWLSKLHHALSAGGIDIAGGGVRNTLRNIYAETSQEMTNYFVAALAEIDPSTTFLTSNNVAYRLEMLKNVGGFDGRFVKAGGEERALHMKILDRGGKSRFVPDCVVDHAHQFSFGKFLRQQFNYGRGSYLIYRVVAGELCSAPRPIPLKVYLQLFGKFFAQGVSRGFGKSILYLLAQCMVIAGYIAPAAAPGKTQTHSPAARS